MQTVLVTGGAGYLGAAVCAELLGGDRRVRVLDCLAHGQDAVAAKLERDGVELYVGDVGDAAARERALRGADAVVHLAAVVGDPACACDPERAEAVNVRAARGVIADARSAGVRRFVFASTCSNYGRRTDPLAAVDEDAPLAPLSLYARQKVAIERLLLEGRWAGLGPTCLRFATVYGVAPRMRFDLTLNEFTRDLWAGRLLDVYGGQFWRPYLHVTDAARAVEAVLRAPREAVAGRVFNVGDTAENYRKRDLVAAVRDRVPTGAVRFVERPEDPRDYRVQFERIRAQLGFVVWRTVPDGIGEVVAALDEGRFGDPFDRRYRNVA